MDGTAGSKDITQWTIHQLYASIGKTMCFLLWSWLAQRTSPNERSISFMQALGKQCAFYCGAGWLKRTSPNERSISFMQALGKKCAFYYLITRVILKKISIEIIFIKIFWEMVFVTHKPITLISSINFSFCFSLFHLSSLNFCCCQPNSVFHLDANVHIMWLWEHSRPAKLQFRLSRWVNIIWS